MTGERAAEDAAAVLASVADPACLVVEILLESYDPRSAELELATRLDVSQGTATSFRVLRGKSSWFHGEGLNSDRLGPRH